MINSHAIQFKHYVEQPLESGNLFRVGFNVATVQAIIGPELLRLVQVFEDDNFIRVEEQRQLRAGLWKRVDERVRQVGGVHEPGRPWWLIPNAHSKRGPGRPRGSFSQAMAWAIEWVRRSPNVTPRQLAKLLNDVGVHVSTDYARPLRLRARAFLAQFGILKVKGQEVDMNGEFL